LRFPLLCPLLWADAPDRIDYRGHSAFWRWLGLTDGAVRVSKWGERLDLLANKPANVVTLRAA